MQQNGAYPIAHWPSNCSSRHSTETRLCCIIVVVVALVDDSVPSDSFLDIDHELCRPEDDFTPGAPNLVVRTTRLRFDVSLTVSNTEDST